MVSIEQYKLGNVIAAGTNARVTIYTDRPGSAATAPPGPAHRTTPALHWPATSHHPPSPGNTNFYIIWRTKTADIKACCTMMTNIIIWLWLSPILDLAILWSCYKIGSCNLVILLQDWILQSCDLAARSDLAILRICYKIGSCNPVILQFSIVIYNSECISPYVRLS